MNAFPSLTQPLNSGPIHRIDASISDEMERISMSFTQPQHETNIADNNDDQNDYTGGKHQPTKTIDVVTTSRLPQWIDQVDARDELIGKERRSQQDKSKRFHHKEQALKLSCSRRQSRLNQRSQTEMLREQLNQSKLMLLLDEAQTKQRRQELELSELRLNRSRNNRLSCTLTSKVNTMSTFMKDAADLTNGLLDRFGPLAGDSGRAHEDGEEGMGGDNRKELSRIRRGIIQELDEPNVVKPLYTEQDEHEEKDWSQVMQSERKIIQGKRHAFLNLLEEHRRRCVERQDIRKEVYALKEENRQIRVERMKSMEETLRSVDKFVPVMQVEIQKTLQAVVAVTATTSADNPVEDVEGIDRARKVLEAAHYSLTAKLYSESELKQGHEEEITKRWAEAIEHMRREMAYLRRHLMKASGGQLSNFGSVDDKPRSASFSSSSKIPTSSAAAKQLGRASVPQVRRLDPVANSRRRYERLNARRRESLDVLLSSLPDVITEGSDEEKTASTRRSRKSGYSSGYSSSALSHSNSNSLVEALLSSSSDEFTSSLDGVPEAPNASKAETAARLSVQETLLISNEVDSPNDDEN